MRMLQVSSCSFALTMMVACGGSAPPPETAAARSEPTPAASPQPAEEAEAAAEPANEEDDTAEPSASHESHAAASPEQSPDHASESHGMKPTRPPSEILTGAKISFMINYPGSSPKRTAEEKCDGESGDDMEARAKCMGEARKEFLADVMLFKKENNAVWWLVYRRDRGNLFEVSKSLVQLTDETENSVTLKLVGKGSGARPVFIGAQQVVVQVPNDSSIELNDPKFGSLVYEARIGAVHD